MWKAISKVALGAAILGMTGAFTTAARTAPFDPQAPAIGDELGKPTLAASESARPLFSFP